MHPLYPFGCDHCERMFTLKPALEAHHAANHRGVEPSAPVSATPVAQDSHNNAQLARGIRLARERRAKR